MTEEQREIVIDSLVKFVERVSKHEGAVEGFQATSSETAALPAVAELLLGLKTMYSPMNLR